MLGYKVFGSGLPNLAMQAMCKDVATGVSAAGSSQVTATELTSASNTVSTVADGSGVILASQGSAGDSQVVFNGGANPLRIYPPSSAKINSLPTNGAMILATNTGCVFHCMSTTQWVGVLSA